MDTETRNTIIKFGVVLIVGLIIGTVAMQFGGYEIVNAEKMAKMQDQETSYTLMVEQVNCLRKACSNESVNQCDQR